MTIKNIIKFKKICDLLIKRDIHIPWYCNVRGDLDYSLLKSMKKAGCRLVTVGFESGCQEVLNNINKGEKVERYYQFAKDAHKAGILVHGCIMAGNPGDSKGTLAKSYAFAKKINCLPDKVFLIGCEPKNIKPSLELSEEVNPSVGKVANRIIGLIERLNN